MSRVLERAPGECDSCEFFSVQPERTYRRPFRDIGTCTHPNGPLKAHTTRGGRPTSVSARTRIVSSGMTCDRFQEAA